MEEQVSKELAKRFNKKGSNKAIKGTADNQVNGKVLIDEYAKPYGGRRLVYRVMYLWNLICTISLAFSVYLSYTYLLLIEKNTRYLHQLMSNNQSIKVESIDGNGTLHLIGGDIVNSDAYNTTIDVRHSVGSLFYSPIDSLLIAPVNVQSFFQLVSPFLTTVLGYLIIYCIEIAYIKSQSLISTSYRVNIRGYSSNGYRYLRRFNLLLTSIFIVEIVIILI